MKRPNRIAAKFMTTVILLAVPCFGAAIGPPDTNCNPATDPPASGGCTWYNFYALTNGSITAGSSYQNYYIAATDPPWTIDTVGTTNLIVLDGGHQGDVFSVFDNNVLLGSTSATSIDANHSCANDSTGQGTDPAACWNDLLMSRGTFALSPGSHSITLTWDQQVPGGDSSLQWFELGAAASGPSPYAVPEPTSMFLLGAGLIVLGLMRWTGRAQAKQNGQR